MGTHHRIWSWTLAAIVLAGVSVPAHAQDADDQQRGVARISLMNGEVSVRRGDAAEWVAGVINAPLMSDDRISTAPNSRAEVEFDASNVMRIGGNAEVHLAQVSDGRYQLEVARGTITWVVLRPSSANVEVDTPSVSVRPNQRGVYRIAVNEQGETQVMSRSGQVEVFTPRGSEWVAAGKMMLARGNPSDPEYQIVNAPPFDDWDHWNQERDQRMLQTNSYQYVPQGVYGAEDLDQYGTWANVEPYGYVWRPTVGIGVDWAPYRTGRWVWEDWYGWTWVSYDPWGWAPYHYGRWFHEPRFGWCWYPGVLGRRHYWSPALVGWFGFGGGGGFGFGFGNIGWVPLAPYETFHPWWGRGFYGRGFNERINITNINVTNVYRNARMGGVSGMNVNDFHNGRFHGGISRFSGNQITTAGAIRGAMPLAPGRNHLQFSDRAAAFTPRSTTNTRFFSQQRPAAVQRVPFEQQRSAFGSRGGVQGGGALENTRPQGAQRSGGGWRNFGAPGGGSPQAASSAQSAEGRRFGGGQPMNQAPQQSRGNFERNAAPSAAPQQRQNRGSWGRFGEPGGSTRPSYASPRSEYQGRSAAPNPRYGVPGGIVRERPSYGAPSDPGRSYGRPSYSAPSAPNPRYSAPPDAGRSYGSRPSFGGARPSYSAPAPAPRQSMPSYSAPSRPSGGGGFGGGSPRGGGGFSAPRSSGGGGGSRPSGGGGNSGGHGGGGHGRR
jgi:hypothetical protein